MLFRRVSRTVCPSSIASSGESTMSLTLSVRYLTTRLKLLLKHFWWKAWKFSSSVLFLVMNKSWDFMVVFVVWTSTSYFPASQRFNWREICPRMSEYEVMPITLCKLTSTKTIRFSETFFKSQTFRSSVVRTWVDVFPTLLSGTLYREEGKGMRFFQASTQKRSSAPRLLSDPGPYTIDLP